MGYVCSDSADSGVSGAEKVAIGMDEAAAANERMEAVRADAEADQDAFTKLRNEVAPTYEGLSAQSWYDATITVSGYLGIMWQALRKTISEMEKICKDFGDTDDAASTRTDNMIECEDGTN